MSQANTTSAAAASAADAALGAVGSTVGGSGVAAKFAGETFRLNLTTVSEGGSQLEWMQVETSDTQPLPRRGACSAARDGLGLVMYGGHDSESRDLTLLGTRLYRLYAKNVAHSGTLSAQWSVLDVSVEQDDALLPPALAYCSLAGATLCVVYSRGVRVSLCVCSYLRAFTPRSHSF